MNEKRSPFIEYVLEVLPPPKKLGAAISTLVLYCGIATFVMWLNASSFDHTEITAVVEMMGMAFAVETVKAKRSE